MDRRLNEINTAALSYLGDCVMELKVRQRLVEQGLASSRALNRAALAFVTAPKQAAAVDRLLPSLTEEETAVYHRGRNRGHSAVPKNATVAEYRMATGLEALFGYLHLAGRFDRIEELFSVAYPITENRKENKSDESQD